MMINRGAVERGLVDVDHDGTGEPDVDLREWTPGEGVNTEDTGAGLDRRRLVAGAVGVGLLYLAWRGSA